MTEWHPSSSNTFYDNNNYINSIDNITDNTVINWNSNKTPFLIVV